MMDDECVDENGAMIWPGLIALAILGSCANMPYYQKEQPRQKSQPHKIERHVQTSDAHRVRQSFYILTR